MDNVLFYTFSTVAQSLAGAIGLLGAFVLWRLQGIDSNLRESAQVAIQPFANDHELLGLSAQGRYDEFIVMLRSRINGPMQSHYSPFQAAQVENMSSVWSNRSAILASLKCTLILTVVVMAASVAMLATVPHITRSLTVTYLVLLGGGVSFLACLIAYVRLIRLMLGAY